MEKFKTKDRPKPSWIKHKNARKYAVFNLVLMSLLIGDLIGGFEACGIVFFVIVLMMATVFTFINAIGFLAFALMNDKRGSIDQRNTSRSQIERMFVLNQTPEPPPIILFVTGICYLVLLVELGHWITFVVYLLFIFINQFVTIGLRTEARKLFREETTRRFEAMDATDILDVEVKETFDMTFEHESGGDN